jgi:hypothetical protein
VSGIGAFTPDKPTLVTSDRQQRDVLYGTILRIDRPTARRCARMGRSAWQQMFALRSFLDAGLKPTMTSDHHQGPSSR